MKHENLVDGVWPTAVTPFTEKGELDIEALHALVDYYHRGGVAGVFGVCQSSEMFTLNRAERERLAEQTMAAAAGKIPVILSGHVSDELRDQADELSALASLKPRAIVLVNNRLAGEDEDDDRWYSRLEDLLSRLPDDIPLGFYECPYPYKRLFTPELLARCAATGRFRFLKDTCCDATMIRERLAAIRGSGLKLFNANAATLLDSLEAGASGYSGIMGNFHPELYVRLCRDWREDPDGAGELMDFLGPAAAIEVHAYPINAKYHLALEGLPFSLVTRTRDAAEFLPYYRLEVEQLRRSAKRRIAMSSGRR